MGFTIRNAASINQYGVAMNPEETIPGILFCPEPMLFHRYEKNGFLPFARQCQAYRQFSDWKNRTPLESPAQAHVL